MERDVRFTETSGRRPLAAIVSCSKVVDGRAIQAVSDRFLMPITQVSGMVPIIVPSLVGTDAAMLADTFDALVLTGSCSNVAPDLYGGGEALEPLDRRRDTTALSLADAMISAGRPVFGICRGLQELNVLYGGTLHHDLSRRTGTTHIAQESSYENSIGSVLHPVDLHDGMLGRSGRIEVVSAHRQGIDRVGRGLRMEAQAPDGLVEAVSDPAHGAVLGVQWHPEWDVASSTSSRRFFEVLGLAARGWRQAA